MLRNLEDYQNTIAIHIYNYSEKLRKISALVSENNIPFLENFTKETSSYFQERIKADIGYFHQGTILLERAISSIRGIVEIEQAERNRSLEDKVQVLSIGFGGGAIISGVIVQHIDNIQKPLVPISFDKPFHPFYASLLLSILATLLFIALGIRITKRE